MTKHNASNERVKRDYLQYLKDARGRDEVTIDRVAKSLARFEETTGRKDFRKFHREQAMAFKRRMAEARNVRTGETLSKATVHSTLSDLKAFFEWLSREPGFRQKIAFSDADYFNLSEKDTAIARAVRDKAVPSVEQLRHVLTAMPANTLVERRDRALIACAAVTGARVSALATFRLGHVNLVGHWIEQDARTVKTKFSKTFRTFFMPVVEGAEAILAQWVTELREQELRGPTDYLFPITEVGVGENGEFEPKGLGRTGWTNTNAIREVFRRAFEAVGLPYFNPHSLRDMLVRHAMSLGINAAQMKAWSQNLGHADVMTTFTSYGAIPVHRQGELIRSIKQTETGADWLSDPEIVTLIQKIRGKQ
jgi:site-specific recombinase XerD